MTQPAFVVLDRDGTLVVERHYLSTPEQVELIPGVAGGLRLLREMGLGLVVITNQSGIGRGFFDATRLSLVHDRMLELLAAEGIHLDGIYVCPHTPEDDCLCRKPKPGLLQRAASELAFAPEAAFVIGDKSCDIDLGRRVGATTFLVRTGYGAQVASDPMVTPDHVVDGVWEAAEIIRRLVPVQEGGSHMYSHADRRVAARTHFLETAEVKRQVAEKELESILTAAELIADTFQSGGKVLLCGNGGSAADCQHMAAEFVSRLTKDFDRPGLPAIALTTDTSFLTAFANDCGYEGVFARQVQALGKPGDVLIGISTSGNSLNVIRAVEAARAMRLRTVALTGTGGRLTAMADVAISAPSTNTQYIQEAHLSIEHLLCHLVERICFPNQR
jgi:phosphoheptose isomerase